MAKDKLDDLWSGCFDPQMNMQPKVFEKTFCRVCLNMSCSRSAGSGMGWVKRISTQEERLLKNPTFADPNDPNFKEIRSVEFPSMFREAIRLEISDRKGDWSVPTEFETDQYSLGLGVIPPSVPPVVIEPKVLQQHEIRGTHGDSYTVKLIEQVDLQKQWVCTCKAFEFGGKKSCKHIVYAMTLPPEDPPDTSKPPVHFQTETHKGGKPFMPSMGNIPAPSVGIMIDGTVPPKPKDRTPPVVIDPWAPPPPKPQVIPVGGRVVLGDGTKK